MITVGCPVSRRAWVIGRWFDAIEYAIDDDIVYVFIGDRNNDPTFEIIEEKRREYNRVAINISVPEQRDEDERVWNPDRYEYMAMLRNMLLQRVRGIAPDYHLSIDSDILLAPDAYNVMLESFRDDWAAIGSKVYLAPVHRGTTNYCMLTGQGNMFRDDATGCFQVDVLMALKLMKPSAYAVDYGPHTQGEDLGWSKNCYNAGLRLGWTGAVTSKHVMSPDRIDVVDERCGY